MKDLILIQSELKAPKTQYNAFGKYNYRNSEDILEAVKPLLLKHECLLTLSDEVVMIGARYYVKSVAKFTNKAGECYHTVGFAREEDDKKGMDGSQITGASSSYARKYALNAMFLIDDTKDSDFTNKHGKNNEKPNKTTSEPKNNFNADEVKTVLQQLHTREEVNLYWKENKALQLNADYKALIKERLTQIDVTQG